MRRMLCVAALSAWLTVFGTGCNTCCNGCRQPLFPRLHQWRHGARSTAPIAQPLPPAPLPPAAPGAIPAPPASAAPEPFPAAPPPPGPPPASPPPAPPPQLDTRSYSPIDSHWHSPSGAIPPQGEQQPQIQLQPPELPLADVPSGRDNQTPAPALPVGIPQFAIVKEGVTAGLKPTVPDGVDWLRDNNYRGVLHILRAGEVDSADRRLFESKGLQYHRIILSPLTIDKAAAEFNRIVGTPSNRPLFVYDKDGLSAGALWYLHFRMVDGDSDAAARRKAKNLGLSEDSSGEAKALWLAIQKLMSELGS